MENPRRKRTLDQKKLQERIAERGKHYNQEKGEGGKGKGTAVLRA